MLWIVRCGLWVAMAALTLVLGTLGLPIVCFLAWRRAWVRGPNALGSPAGNPSAIPPFELVG